MPAHIVAKSLVAAALLAGSVPAVAQQQFPLMPLENADSAFMEGGYSCFVGRGSRTLFLLDSSAGVIRYRGRVVRLRRAQRIAMNPNNLRSLSVTGGRARDSYRVDFAPRRGRTEEGQGSYSQPVRMTVRRLTGGRATVHGLDTVLTCAS